MNKRLRVKLPEFHTALAEIRAVGREIRYFAHEASVAREAHLAVVQRIATRLDTLKPVVEVKLTPLQTAQIAEWFNDPLILSAEVSKQIADNASTPQFFTAPAMYMGSYQIQSEWLARPDGTLELTIKGIHGERAWRGTFHGPRDK